MSDPADCCFDLEPSQRRVARQLYELIASLPLVCPHGHVDPRLFATDAPLGTPADLARQLGGKQRLKIEVAPETMANALAALARRFEA